MSSLVKGFGAVLCLVFALSFAAPNAHADTLYQYNVSGGNSAFRYSFTTIPIPVSDLGVLLPPSDLSAFSLTGFFWSGGTITGVILDAGGDGTIEIHSTRGDGSPSAFAPADYTSPGFYGGHIASIMEVTAVATPEPSSIALVLSGVGLVFAMRKRFSGLHQTS